MYSPILLLSIYALVDLNQLILDNTLYDRVQITISTIFRINDYVINWFLNNDFVMIMKLFNCCFKCILYRQFFLCLCFWFIIYFLAHKLIIYGLRYVFIVLKWLIFWHRLFKTVVIIIMTFWFIIIIRLLLFISYACFLTLDRGIDRGQSSRFLQICINLWLSFLHKLL